MKRTFISALFLWLLASAGYSDGPVIYYDSTQPADARLRRSGLTTGDAGGLTALAEADFQGGIEVDTVQSLTGDNWLIYDDGTNAITIGAAGAASLTVTTNGTGDGEVVLPADSIGTAELNDTGDTPGDEEILTYEATGTKFEYHTPAELSLLTTASFANPTATVNGTVVNGTATTAMRSDGAPALADPVVPADTKQDITGALQASTILNAGAVPSDSSGRNVTGYSASVLSVIRAWCGGAAGLWSGFENIGTGSGAGRILGGIRSTSDGSNVAITETWSSGNSAIDANPNVISGTIFRQLRETGALGTFRHYLSEDDANDIVRLSMSMLDTNATPAPTIYGALDTILEDPTDTSEDGEARILTMRAGTLTEAIRFANTGEVGINTSTPTDILDVNGSTVRIRTASTPASASATGDAGEIRWDSSFIYVCVATDTWKRVAIATW